MQKALLDIDNLRYSWNSSCSIKKVEKPYQKAGQSLAYEYHFVKNVASKQKQLDVIISEEQANEVISKIGLTVTGRSTDQKLFVYTKAVDGNTGVTILY